MSDRVCLPAARRRLGQLNGALASGRPLMAAPGWPASGAPAVQNNSAQSQPADAMPALDKYLFDLNGYVVIKAVFTAGEIASANAAIDAHTGEQHERLHALRNTKPGSSLAGDGKTGRLDLGRCLEWPAPESDTFRRLLAHPRVVPYLNVLCGVGYRMDHLPLVLAQNAGAEGFQLHGGVT
eukprot:SAG31_NODE_17021_length_686_cov_1.117547_1_plen_180_part_01